MDGPNPPGGPGVLVEPFLSRAFQQWAYVVRRPGRGDALVVDPGLECRPLLAHLRGHGLRPAAILNTHGHADHIAGNRDLKEAFPDAPLWIGRNDAPMLGDPEANLSAPFGAPSRSPPADRLLDDGETVEVAGFAFEVREIPGHSPGSVVLVARGESPPFVLGGDVLFRGSIGRSDFPYGDGPRLIAGIRSKLLTLPEETIVYPGHGPATTVGHERRTNPFVGDPATITGPGPGPTG